LHCSRNFLILSTSLYSVPISDIYNFINSLYEFSFFEYLLFIYYYFNLSNRFVFSSKFLALLYIVYNIVLFSFSKLYLIIIHPNNCSLFSAKSGFIQTIFHQRYVLFDNKYSSTWSVAVHMFFCTVVHFVHLLTNSEKTSSYIAFFLKLFLYAAILFCRSSLFPY